MRIVVKRTYVHGATNAHFAPFLEFELSDNSNHKTYVLFGRPTTTYSGFASNGTRRKVETLVGKPETPCKRKNTRYCTVWAPKTKT
jgi:hypothetical protein